MIIYIFYLAFIIAIVLPVFYFIKRNPDLAFWILLNIYFDPGGYLTYYFEGKIFSRLIISDVVILPIIFCLYSINTSYKVIYKDQFFIKFLKVFSIFAAYFLIFYGGIVPYINNDLNYISFLQKNRYFLYYIIILISTYIFAIRGLKYFYTTTLFFGLIILSAFLITLLTGLNLIPVDLLERYEGSGIMRIGIYSWGLISILFPLSFIIFSFSRKIKLKIEYKKMAFIAGVLMLVTLLVALSRRVFIDIPATLLIISILNSIIFKKSAAVGITKILVPIAAVLLVINLALPKYIDYIADISEDTFSLVTEGKDTRGEEDYRVSRSGDFEITKKFISDNFLLGTGYVYVYTIGHDFYSSRGSLYLKAVHPASEVPIYYIFFSYGLAGFIIILFLYSYIIRLFLRLYSLVKKNINQLKDYPYEVLFVFYFLFMVANKFTFSFYNLGRDFTSANSAIYIAMGFVLLRKLKGINSETVIYASSENRLQKINTLID